MTNNTLILRIDPTTLSRIDCLQAFKLFNLSGLTAAKPCHRLEWGSAFHKFVAVWKKTGDSVVAVQAGIDYILNSKADFSTDYRNMSLLMLAMSDYIKEYTVDDFEILQIADKEGKPQHAVELPFKQPLYTTGEVHPFQHIDGQTYNQIDVILCGVIDAIGKQRSKIVFKDIKTTSSNAKYTEQYFNSYNTSIQMMVYSMVLKNMGLCDYYPPCIIDGVFLSKTGVVCQRSSLLDFREDLIESTYAWILDKVISVCENVQEGVFLRNFSRCETKFGKCEFHGYCTAPEIFREDILKRSFVTRTYDPETFGQQES